MTTKNPGEKASEKGTRRAAIYCPGGFSKIFVKQHIYGFYGDPTENLINCQWSFSYCCS
jgi:hypothetical protein